MTQPDCTHSKPTSTRQMLLGIWSHLRRRRRIQLGLLLVVMLASGGSELASLGAVLPFLAALSDPALLWQQPLIHQFATWVGITRPNQLLLPTTLAFALAAVFAALIRTTNLWLNGRVAAAVGSDLSCEAYRHTLYQPYEVHVQQNSSEVITGITNQISQTVNALNSLLQLITSAAVAAGLLSGLLLIDAQVAVLSVVLFGSCYLALAAVVQHELRHNGKKIVETSKRQLKALQEGLGATRDVLLDGTQELYLQVYRRADRPQRQLQAKNEFLATSPRFSIEALGMVAIAFLGGLLVLQRGSGTSVIPILGSMALGAQRLLPAFQQIYNGWAALKNYGEGIQGVLSILNQPLPLQTQAVEPLQLRDSICFESVNFRYGPQQPEVLRGLDIEVRRGQRIGLIGTTGSGKSTTVDLLMGLLTPTAGRVLVDGKDLHDPMHPERISAWRATIAHVPQSIYLADSSIAENIAFGVPLQQIDLQRVKQAAARAQIASFIESSTDGYSTQVGERGIRLSGGQRQRIGIARALYKEAQVLVLDEATSALDNSTEDAVMDSFELLSKDLTVVMIAHRLSTLRQCDYIIEMVNGKARIQDL